MPELPEVETVKRTLSPLVSGKRIISIEAVRPEILAHPEASAFCRRITGATLQELQRIGKYLLLPLDNGTTIILHLRMTGRLLYTPADYPRKPHTHIIFHLDDGHELRFSDTRRFGRLWLKEDAEEDTFSGIHRLGPEPFGAPFDSEWLATKLGKRKINIKQGLLDQSVVAGLGNIYVDEVLFAAKIDPRRLTNQVTKQEWQLVAIEIPRILTAAIANNGTTFRDYLDGTGQKGSYMPFLEAYGRKGQPCSCCGTIIEQIRLAGRSTCYCPQCQK